MRRWTVHAPPPSSVPATEGAPPRPPVLLREGFAPWAFLLGPLWFLANRLWLEAGVMLALTAVALAVPGSGAAFALLALHLLAGFEARDALRRRLARRGRPELAVVVADSAELAWFRLGQARPDLVRALP